MSWDHWHLIMVVGLAGFIGLLFDQMMLFMLLGTLFYSFWLQRSWNQLWYWLDNPKKNSPPSANGVIDNVCRQIEGMRLQNRSRKKRLGDYLKQFQAATAALPDAVVVLGSQGQITWANKAAKTLLGIHWAHDNGVRIHDLIRDPVFQKLLLTDANREKAKIVSSPINSERHLEIKIVTYMGDERLLIARDISQAMKVQQMRKDFVANVSHELRTPLTVLHGYLETFDEDSPSTVWATALPVMRQQTQRMNAMIHDLLMLSQLEMDENKPHYQPVNICKLFTAIVEDARQLKDYNNHAIELDISSDARLLADKAELRSALSNLLFNAVKYTPKQTRIVLNWRVDNRGGYISVNDAGEGIEAQHLDRLTERFYRVAGGQAQDSNATGLGLAIVKHILKRHDARLSISSEVGVGSQFQCCFPKNNIVKAGRIKSQV